MAVQDRSGIQGSAGGTAPRPRAALASFLAELRRRRVLRVLIGYGIAAFALLQVVEPVVHGLRLPEWLITLVVILLAFGFPVALALAWAFDLTPSGIERTRPLAEQPAPAEQEAPGPSIAVLPFADLSPQRDQDYFCDGVAEELLNALSGVSGLRVAARSSAFQFKGRAVDGREIGRALGVATLLEGSVRKAGDQLRVAARLINGADGYQLWSGSFDRRVDDVFAIQEEIARSVVGALRVQLSSREAGRLARPATRSTPAYEMYLRGRQFLTRQDENGLRFARQMFKGAIELDPTFAQAHAGLADTCYFILQWHLDEAHAEALRGESLSASDEALRLDPQLAEARVSRGNVLSALGRDEEADRDFRRAIELNPALPDAHYFYARHLFAAGRLGDAARHYAEAARINPEDFASLALLATVYRERGERKEADATAALGLAAVERRLRLNPDDVRALYLGGGLAIQVGDRARGLERLARAVELQPGDFTTLYNVACGYALAGEVELALDTLDRAVGTGRGFRRWMENDDDLAPLRGDPRFRQILERVKS